MLDATNPFHSMDGSMDNQLDLYKVPNGFFKSRCDQDPSAVKTIPEYDPNETIFSPLLM